VRLTGCELRLWRVRDTVAQRIHPKGRETSGAADGLCGQQIGMSARAVPTAIALWRRGSETVVADCSVSSIRRNKRGILPMLVLFVLALLVPSKADFVYKDFNDTTGLVFVGDAGTTDCNLSPDHAYGDVQGKADLFNENALSEIAETTDSVSESEVETNKQQYNDEILTRQAGFLHIAQTISAPKVCKGRARLTPSNPSKTGALWYRSEVPVSHGFDTEFEFQISDHSKECSVHKDQYFSQFSYRTCSVHGGDGFAFVIQNSDRQRLEGVYELGQNGGQMGFGGIPNSLAVAFDMWTNPGQDTLGVDHISIQSLGQRPNDALELGLLGVPRSHTIADGVIHRARIRYFTSLQSQYLANLSASTSLLPYLLDNGEQKRVGTLVVFMDDGIAKNDPIIAMPINLSLVVHMPSDKAYVGFTSSTGRFFEKHDILNWMWCDHNPQGSEVCEPASKSTFDLHQQSSFSSAGYQRFVPGAGYGGSADAVEFPTHNENPITDPWALPVEHFANSRTHDLFGSATQQVPPATLY